MVFEQGLRDKAHIILEGTTPNIDFGAILTSESPSSGVVGTAESDPCSESGHMPGYIWSLGMRPDTVRGPLALVRDSPITETPDEYDFSEGDGVYHQLVDGIDDSGGPKSGVLSLLEKHSLALQAGPYADKDGIVAAFADIVFKGARRDKLNELIERIIDTRPFTVPEFEVGPFQRKFPLQVGFISRKDFMPPDELPTAGNILRQERLMQFKSGKKFQLVHPMEQYVLAVAALRMRGFNAYPAIATLTNADSQPGSTRPLIAVIDMKNQNPLTTFDLNRRHPEMDTMTILSDVAVMGALHAMRAETRCKHLAAEMVRCGEQGTYLSVDDMATQLHRIARSLFESVKRWDKNQLISKAMTLLYGLSGNAYMESALKIHEKTYGKEVAEALNSRIEEMISKGIPPATLTSDEDPVIKGAANLLCVMTESRDQIIDTVQTLFGAYITKAQK